MNALSGASVKTAQEKGKTLLTVPLSAEGVLVLEAEKK